jgi:hypothetical protein
MQGRVRGRGASHAEPAMQACSRGDTRYQKESSNAELCAAVQDASRKIG